LHRTLTSIIQHIDFDHPCRQAILYRATNTSAYGHAKFSITASRLGVIYLKSDFGLDFEQAQFSRPCNGFGPVMGFQLPENMVDMALDRSDRDHELLCDLMI
jgi:hypothetical protein